jgi:hypothetical protein
MKSEMIPAVSPKVKLTPDGAPPVRQNTWRDEADKCDNDFVMMLWFCGDTCFLVLVRGSSKGKANT